MLLVSNDPKLISYEFSMLNILLRLGDMFLKISAASTLNQDNQDREYHLPITLRPWSTQYF